MRKISLEKIDSLFSAIAENNVLYMPVDTKTGAKYEKWENGKKLSDSLNTVRSAKDFFFPQTENLMDFKVEGKKIEVIDTRSETEDFVVFGVRACDARSFEILDKVFLKEPVDTFYASRREMGTVITLACTKPDETCFCQSFGIDPADPAGDVSCWMDEENLYWKANTAKGETLTSELPMLEDGGEEAVKTQQEKTHAILEKLPLAQLNLSKVGAGKTEALFNRPEWKSLSESCLGCGTCTFVCPTCQCYDVQEFNTGKTVRRFRCWDSCMYSDFTKMSAGQPRPTQLERFRQRFMHKLVYFPDNNDGQFGCVGCGRCLQKCPIHMNIVKVIKTMGGGDDAK